MVKRILNPFLILILLIFFSCRTSSETKTGKTEDLAARTDSTDINKPDSEIYEKYWKLTEVNGKNISDYPGLNKEPHLIFTKEGNKINGNGSCNAFFGNYEIKAGYRISFSKIGATEMACENMEVEMQLFQALNAADNYYLNGDTLVLNKGKMAPLARFVSSYIK